jgi:hypothetical protein
LGGVVAATAALVLGTALATTATAATTAPQTTTVPRLDHVFLIMEENNGFSDVIGNPAAPNLNYLATTFGLETNYYGLTTNSSEENYVGLLGGSTHNVTSDDAYWKNTVNAPDLISQLDHAGVSWKAYLQSLPYAGYEGICYPTKCNGAPDNDPLYVSKHDAIQNYTTSRSPRDWSRQVPIGQLGSDLSTGDVPRFSYVVPDECHDMHGDPPYCVDSGNIGDPQNQHLVAQGDAYLGHLVSAITHAGFWAKGNNAVIVTFDNGDDTQGCCDANPGGGQVATVVITSHGPRHVTDNAPANHYSTLQTIEDTFGLGCLNATCDTANVQPLSGLLTATGSAAVATAVRPELTWPTPTLSQPAEPLGVTPAVAGGDGWTVPLMQTLGGSDNSLGAIAGSSSSDVWAVGNYLPDAPNSNQDATLTFAEHYDGKTWSVVRTPNSGPNYDTLWGVTDSAGQAWAVGVTMSDHYQDRALVEHWNGTSWSVTDVPQPGKQRDILFSASSTSPTDVWAVGDQEGSDGRFETLAEHFDGHAWSVVPTPDPGGAGNHLYGVDAVSPDNVWAVGQQLSGAGTADQGLVEHWDGSHWSVVDLPASPANVMLHAVAVSGGQVFAVGESDSPAAGQALIMHEAGGHWSTEHLPSLPSNASNWANLWSVAAAGGAVYAVGTYVDNVTDNNDLLVLKAQLDGAGVGTWTVDNAPIPGSGSNIAGGIAAVDGHLWMAGTMDDGGSRLPMTEVH